MTKKGEGLSAAERKAKSRKRQREADEAGYLAKNAEEAREMRKRKKQNLELLKHQADERKNLLRSQDKLAKDLTKRQAKLSKDLAKDAPKGQNKLAKSVQKSGHKIRDFLGRHLLKSARGRNCVDEGGEAELQESQSNLKSIPEIDSVSFTNEFTDAVSKSVTCNNDEEKSIDGQSEVSSFSSPHAVKSPPFQSSPFQSPQLLKKEEKWIVLFDENRNVSYFHEIHSGCVQWEPPVDNNVTVTTASGHVEFFAIAGDEEGNGEDSNRSDVSNATSTENMVHQNKNWQPGQSILSP